MQHMAITIRLAPMLLPVLLAASCSGSADTASPRKSPPPESRAQAVCGQHFPHVRLSEATTIEGVRFLGPHPTPGPNAPKGNFPTVQNNVYVALCLVPTSSSTKFAVYGVPSGMSPTRLWTQNVANRLVIPG